MLTKEQKEELASRINSGENAKQVCDEFGIHTSTGWYHASRAKKGILGRTWKKSDLGGPYKNKPGPKKKVYTEIALENHAAAESLPIAGSDKVFLLIGSHESITKALKGLV